VVGLGGGAVLRPANQELILQTGRRVWLDAPADVLFQRISHDQSSTQRRPNLTDRGGYDEVAQMLAVRRPIYGRLAELVVNTQGKTPDQIVVEISDWQKHYEQPKLNS
jgi:shikimate kinase